MDYRRKEVRVPRDGEKVTRRFEDIEFMLFLKEKKNLCEGLGMRVAEL